MKICMVLALVVVYHTIIDSIESASSPSTDEPTTAAYVTRAPEAPPEKVRDGIISTLKSLGTYVYNLPGSNDDPNIGDDELQMTYMFAPTNDLRSDDTLDTGVEISVELPLEQGPDGMMNMGHDYKYTEQNFGYSIASMQLGANQVRKSNKQIFQDVLNNFLQQLNPNQAVEVSGFESGDYEDTPVKPDIPTSSIQYPGPPPPSNQAMNKPPPSNQTMNPPSNRTLNKPPPKKFTELRLGFGATIREYDGSPPLDMVANTTISQTPPYPSFDSGPMLNGNRIVIDGDGVVSQYQQQFTNHDIEGELHFLNTTQLISVQDYSNLQSQTANWLINNCERIMGSSRCSVVDLQLDSSSGICRFKLHAQSCQTPVTINLFTDILYNNADYFPGLMQIDKPSIVINIAVHAGGHLMPNGQNQPLMMPKCPVGTGLSSFNLSLKLVEGSFSFGVQKTSELNDSSNAVYKMMRNSTKQWLESTCQKAFLTPNCSVSAVQFYGQPLTIKYYLEVNTLNNIAIFKTLLLNSTPPEFIAMNIQRNAFSMTSKPATCTEYAGICQSDLNPCATGIKVQAPELCPSCGVCCLSTINLCSGKNGSCHLVEEDFMCGGVWLDNLCGSPSARCCIDDANLAFQCSSFGGKCVSSNATCVGNKIDVCLSPDQTCCLTPLPPTTACTNRNGACQWSILPCHGVLTQSCSGSNVSCCTPFPATDTYCWQSKGLCIPSIEPCNGSIQNDILCRDPQHRCCAPTQSITDRCASINGSCVWMRGQCAGVRVKGGCNDVNTICCAPKAPSEQLCWERQGVCQVETDVCHGYKGYNLCDMSPICCLPPMSTDADCTDAGGICISLSNSDSCGGMSLYGLCSDESNICCVNQLPKGSVSATVQTPTAPIVTKYIVGQHTSPDCAMCICAIVSNVNGPGCGPAPASTCNGQNGCLVSNNTCYCGPNRLTKQYFNTCYTAALQYGNMLSTTDWYGCASNVSCSTACVTAYTTNSGGICANKPSTELTCRDYALAHLSQVYTMSCGGLSSTFIVSDKMALLDACCANQKC